jgi:zinc protease
MKEERPFKKGPCIFVCVGALSLFMLLGMTVSGVVHAMNLFSLDNGLQYIFEKRKGTGVVAIQVWVKVGSKSEERKIAGITHFIEHLIFKGTERVKANELASRIESLGGTVNAFTSYDNTVYHIVIPARAFEEGFGLLADAVKNPLFPEPEIVKEKRVVLEEIKMGEDDPQRKLFNELFSVSFEGHPYGRPIIGFDKTVKALDREDIQTYYKTHYPPENMVIVVVGDFDEEKARKLIEKETGAQGRKERIARRAASSVPDDSRKEDPLPSTAGKQSKDKVIEKELRESYLALAYRVPAIAHEDIAALEVLETILGNGESSRFQDQLKQKKSIVTNSSTYLFTPKEAGLFIVLASFKGKDYGAVVKGIDEEIDRFEKEGASPEELQKARNIIEASYIYGSETVQGRARQIGYYYTLTGDPRFIDGYLTAIDKVTGDDVKRVLGKYVVGKERAMVTLLSREKSNPHTFLLKNGLTCVINRNPASPSFAFRIGFVGGLKEEPKGKNGLFNLLSRTLMKGTKTKDAAAIAREIDLLAGDLTPYTGRNVFGLSGKFLSKDMKEVFTLLKELLVETRPTKEGVKKTKDEALSEIRQRDDDPIGYTFMRFNEVLYEGHPYGRDPSGTEADVEEIGVDQIQKAYGDYVVPGGAVIAISGDVDEKKLVDLLDKLFMGWTGAGKAMRKEQVQAPRKAEKHVEKDIVQTHLVFGFPGPGLIDRDRHAVEVMNAILSGMGGRIHRVLREENPYAYAVTFFNQMAYEAGGVGVYIGTDRKLTGKVEKIVRAEMEKIVREGFTEKEVENARTYLVGNHYVRMQSNGAVSTNMCLDTMYGLKADYFKVWPKHVDTVTREDVNVAARKYLSLEKMIEISVGRHE